MNAIVAIYLWHVQHFPNRLISQSCVHKFLRCPQIAKKNKIKNCPQLRTKQSAFDWGGKLPLWSQHCPWPTPYYLLLYKQSWNQITYRKPVFFCFCFCNPAVSGDFYIPPSSQHRKRNDVNLQCCTYCGENGVTATSYSDMQAKCREIYFLCDAIAMKHRQS